MSTARVLLRPENGAGRLSPKKRPTELIVINSTDDLTATTAQYQFLGRRHIAESRLGLLASLIWEVRNV